MDINPSEKRKNRDVVTLYGATERGRFIRALPLRTIFSMRAVEVAPAETEVTVSHENLRKTARNIRQKKGSGDEYLADQIEAYVTERLEAT